MLEEKGVLHINRAVSRWEYGKAIVHPKKGQMYLLGKALQPVQVLPGY